MRTTRNERLVWDERVGSNDRKIFSQRPEKRKVPEPRELPGLHGRGAAELPATSAQNRELAELLTLARASGHVRGAKPLHQQNGLHRSVEKLMVSDYEAGASSLSLRYRDL